MNIFYSHASCGFNHSHQDDLTCLKGPWNVPSVAFKKKDRNLQKLQLKVQLQLKVAIAGVKNIVEKVL